MFSASRKQKIARLQAYRNVFSSDDGKLILADLKKFCRGGRPPSHNINNSHETALLIGRQEVFYRIAEAANLSDAVIYELMQHQHEGESDE